MRLTGFGFAIAVSTAALAQFPPLQPGGENGGEAFTGYLDVAATDASGRPVPGLSAADFKVTQDGKALSILKFVAGASGHSVVLVVDDMGLSLPGLDRVRQALQKFLAEGMAAGDRAAIVRTSGGSASLLQLSSDRKVLADELERIDLHPFADPAGTQPGAFLAGTLQGLRVVMDGLGGAPGRKAVVLLSERLNFSAQANSETGIAIESIAMRCTELAQMAEAVFYAVDVREGNRAQAASQVQLATGIAGIAADTGGLMLDSAAGVPAALERVLQDQGGAYRLGFSSEESYRDFGTGTKVYRKIAVRTERPGIALRARNNVYEPPQQPVDNGLAVDLTPIFQPAPGSGNSANVLIRADGRNLASVRDLHGRYNSIFEMDATMFDAYGKAGPQKRETLEARFLDAGFEAARKYGIVYPFRTPVNSAGLHRILVRVADDTGGHTGVSSEVFAVPAAVNGELMLSGITLAPGADDKAPPDLAIREGSAVRQYPTGATIRYHFDLLNLARNPSKQSSVEMRTTILRYGRPISVSRPRTISFANTGNPAYRVGGEIRTLQSLTPGRYVLAVTVTDQLASKPKEVRQYTDFWVLP